MFAVAKILLLAVYVYFFLFGLSAYFVQHDRTAIAAIMVCLICGVGSHKFTAPRK